MLKRFLASSLLIGLIAYPAAAQTVTTKDISDQLQSSLEASAPTIVYFEFDKDQITEDTQVILLQQANWLMSNPEAKVNLAGHADAVGSDSYNIDLAMRRAQAVESFLLGQGVNAAQMQSVVSRGESELAIQTQTREKLNRRVTTGVTGLVEIYAELTPAPTPVYTPPPPPAPRRYADVLPATCSDNQSLASMSDLSALSVALESRMDAAMNVYMSETARSSNTNTYDLAAFAKAECGIAIGFTKSNIKDKRSIANCECFSDAIKNG